MKVRQLRRLMAVDAAATAILAGPTEKKQTQMKDTWVQQHLTDTKSILPFPFTYNGQPSAKLLTE